MNTALMSNMALLVALLMALALPRGAHAMDDTAMVELEEAGLAVPADAQPQPLDARRRDHRHRRAQPLGSAAEVDAHALALLPYAALATEVYCSAIVENKAGEDCENRRLARSHGWRRLKSYPTDLNEPQDFRGMIFATYWRDRGRARPVEIAVAFRGTDFGSPADWRANLRWMLPGRDQYDVLSDWVPRVIEESKAAVLERLRHLGRPVEDVQWHIVATGHSLGGGLAQLFAYKSTEVKAAIAFDPSPVTGFHSCVSHEEVHCNVPVWRVYEHGEVLAYLRTVTRLVYPLSENITELEFRLVGGNPILNHNMPRFYDSLNRHLRNNAGHVAAVPADLFQEKPDCDCSLLRRPALYAQVREVCDRLLAQRDPPPVSMGDASPDWPEMMELFRRGPPSADGLQAAAALP